MSPRHKVHEQQGAFLTHIVPGFYDEGVANHGHEQIVAESEHFNPLEEPAIDLPRPAVNLLPTSVGEPGTYMELKDRPAQLRGLVRALDHFSEANRLDGYHFMLENNHQFRELRFQDFRDKARNRASELGEAAKSDDELREEFNTYVNDLPARVKENLTQASRAYQSATATGYELLRASNVFDPQEVDDEEMITSREFDNKYGPPDSHKLFVPLSRKAKANRQKARTDTRKQFKKVSEKAIEAYQRLNLDTE